MLVDGVTVEYRRADGSIGGAQARVLDFDEPANNDWLAVNQFTVVEGQHNRRPDVVVFVNGLPLAVIELKNAADENADHLERPSTSSRPTRPQIPSLFASNELLVVSDGIAGADRRPRRRPGVVQAVADHRAARTMRRPAMPELEVLLEGVFEQRRFLDLIRYFIVFEDDGDGELIKKMAGYHQFHAVNIALAETLARCRSRRSASRRPIRVRPQPGGEGDRRIGVVWHTQGSGKSLTMVFYAGRIILAPGDGEPDASWSSPTATTWTTSSSARSPAASELLRQPPVQADDRADLREKLAGGLRRRGLHHHPEVLPRGEGRPAPGALRPAQHRGDRRRGPPQPVRLHRRLRPPHARRPAQRLVHRLHRHAHRADRRQHPGRVRRLHQRLRHPAGGRGRRHGAHLLREPAGQAGAGRGRAARTSTPSSRRSPRARRSSARRS